MAPHIFGVRSGIHIFDLVQTREHLKNMCSAIQELQKQGKTLLFVSTKQQTIRFIEEIGKQTGQPTVTKKWIPGLLTNWPTVKKRLKYYLDLQQQFRSGEVEKYTKKEQTRLRKELTKLDAALGGVSNMKDVPDALFVIDAVRDSVAVLEAYKLGIPVYGICDSNADPTKFAEFVPCNDDAVNAVALILDTISKALGAKSKENFDSTTAR